MDISKTTDKNAHDQLQIYKEALNQLTEEMLTQVSGGGDYDLAAAAPACW